MPQDPHKDDRVRRLRLMVERPAEPRDGPQDELLDFDPAAIDAAVPPIVFRVDEGAPDPLPALDPTVQDLASAPDAPGCSSPPHLGAAPARDAPESNASSGEARTPHADDQSRRSPATVTDSIFAQQIAPHIWHIGAAAQRRRRSLSFRRTVIPILITLAVAFPSLAALWLASPPESALRSTGAWLPLALLLAGVVILLLAVINIAQVKHMLDEDALESSRRGQGRAGGGTAALR